MPARLPSRLVLQLASLLALAACSGGQAPQRVQPVAPVDSVRTLGALQVRYNALPSLALPDRRPRPTGWTAAPAGRW